MVLFIVAVWNWTFSIFELYIFKVLLEKKNKVLLVMYQWMQWLHNVVILLLGTARLFPTVAVPFYVPISDVWGVQFFHILINPCYCHFFYSDFSEYKVVSHLWAWFPLPWCPVTLNIFLHHLCIFFGEISVQIHYSFLIGPLFFKIKY